MSFKKNDVVTVMTVVGEFVGKFVMQDANRLVIADPKMLVNNETGLGFSTGIAVTGKEYPPKATFYPGGLVFVVEASDRVLDSYYEAVDGAYDND